MKTFKFTTQLYTNKDQWVILPTLILNITEKSFDLKWLCGGVKFQKI